MQQGQFGADFSLYLLFYSFPLFSEIFISIDEYANNIINPHIVQNSGIDTIKYHNRPFHWMKVLYLGFNLRASKLV